MTASGALSELPRHAPVTSYLPKLGGQPVSGDGPIDFRFSRILQRSLNLGELIGLTKLYDCGWLKKIGVI